MTADLTAFLLARIDEDGAAARAATPGPWLLESQMVNPPRPLAVWLRRECQPGDLLVTRGANPADLTHIARHDPARVLAECEAKRELMEWHKLYGMPRLGARILAAVYASHPDYREDWRV